MADVRPRKARHFPSAAVEPPDVYFLWDATPDEATRSQLEWILDRTCSLGHSASLISVEIVDRIPASGYERWDPTATIGRGERLRIPFEGWLDQLRQAHGRFVHDPLKTNRPPAGRSVVYRRPTPPRVSHPKSLFREMIVLRRRPEQRAAPRLGLPSTLQLTSALRGAMLTHAPQPVPEFLSGHTSAGSPAERPHVALAPLAFVGTRYATGEVLGLAALLPELQDRDREICWTTFARLGELRMGFGGLWEVEIADSDEDRTALQEETWCGPAEWWSTVTPFVFDRFPKDPYGEEAEALVRTAIVRIGLPEPVKVALHYNPWHPGVPKAKAFPPPAARPGKPQRYHTHALIRFTEPVEGPIAAGAGRFYGYGLFRPHDAERRR
jgi:CRISPR-associated protein Csb2